MGDDNKMYLTRVTITGADDKSSITELRDMAKEYPFTEWGILVGNHIGVPRFPTMEWLRLLCKALPKSVPLSLHICGSAVRRLLMGYTPEPEGIFSSNHSHFLYRFNRVQLNTHGVPQTWMLEDFRRVMRHLFSHQQIIIQMDGTENEQQLMPLRNLRVDAVPLFDLSHGAGVAPEEWPKPNSAVPFHGYAGGLGPRNIRAELTKIAQVANGHRVWVDMETNVRTDEDLDMEKVHQCLMTGSTFVQRPPDLPPIC